MLGGCALLFVVGVVDDLHALPAWAKLGAQMGAAAIALASGLTVELVGSDWIAVAAGVIWLVGNDDAFNLLDNMDGLAATLAAIAAGYFALDAVTVQPNDPWCSCSRSRSRSPASASCASTCACAGQADAFMGDSGSPDARLRRSRASGLLTSYKVAGSTAATLLLPILDPRRADPRHDARDGRSGCSRGAPFTRAGATTRRTGSCTTGSRRSESWSCSRSLAAALGELELRLLRPQQHARDAVRRPADLRTARAVREPAPPTHDRDRSSEMTFFAVHRRRFVEVVVDFALICARVPQPRTCSASRGRGRSRSGLRMTNRIPRKLIVDGSTRFHQIVTLMPLVI